MRSLFEGDKTGGLAGGCRRIVVGLRLTNRGGQSDRTRNEEYQSCFHIPFPLNTNAAAQIQVLGVATGFVLPVGDVRFVWKRMKVWIDRKLSIARARHGANPSNLSEIANRSYLQYVHRDHPLAKAVASWSRSD